jgi:hypothetical protein
MSPKNFLAASALTLFLSHGAFAATYSTFDFSYSGRGFGNSATVSGSLTVDSSMLPSLTDTVIDLPSFAVVALQMNVSSNLGQATYGLNDFHGLVFNIPRPLDLTRELVGQTYADGNYFLDAEEDDPGHFAFYGKTGAPTEYATDNLYVGNDLYLEITSLRMVSAISPVSEPETYAMLLGGLGLMFLIAGLRRKTPMRFSAVSV